MTNKNVFLVGCTKQIDAVFNVFKAVVLRSEIKKRKKKQIPLQDYPGLFSQPLACSLLTAKRHPTNVFIG